MPREVFGLYRCSIGTPGVVNSMTEITGRAEREWKALDESNDKRYDRKENKLGIIIRKLNSLGKINQTVVCVGSCGK